MLKSIWASPFRRRGLNAYERLGHSIVDLPGNAVSLFLRRLLGLPLKLQVSL
jgi:hypothetical protein